MERKIKECQLCKEHCPQCETANEIAKARMYATNEVIRLQKELEEYKRLEEQGLLLKLPCKVGDILWNIENGVVESFVVEEFRICAYRIDRIEIYFENASGFGLCLFDGTLDEGWYKTLEEAEAKLQELQNGVTQSNDGVNELKNELNEMAGEP